MQKFKEEIIVTNPYGLHARPAALFVQIANKYDSAVNLEKNGELVDGKSIIAILSLGINKGTKVSLVVKGQDAREAIVELKNFLERQGDA